MCNAFWRKIESNLEYSVDWFSIGFPPSNHLQISNLVYGKRMFNCLWRYTFKFYCDKHLNKHIIDAYISRYAHVRILFYTNGLTYVDIPK